MKRFIKLVKSGLVAAACVSVASYMIQRAYIRYQVEQAWQRGVVLFVCWSPVGPAFVHGVLTFAVWSASAAAVVTLAKRKHRSQHDTNAT